jgi:hypothetical protein
VGDQELVYQQLVVGGASIESSSSLVYRADSGICQAAIHAGVLTERPRGPVILRLLGEHTGFQAFDRNGVHSVGFDADFPKAFTFISLGSTEMRAFNIRWPILLFNTEQTNEDWLTLAGKYPSAGEFNVENSNSLTIASALSRVYARLRLRVLAIGIKPCY